MSQLLCIEDRVEGQTDESAFTGHRVGEPARIVSLTGDMPVVERSPANAGVQVECRKGCRW